MASRNVPWSVAVALALVAGLTPFAADAYLASLPTISAEFDSEVWLTQLTLTGYLLLLGLAQLVAGPLTDTLGRRVPLIVGLVIFILGSLVAAAAPGITVLIIARALQGLSGAMILVVASSMVRDLTSGDGVARLFALLYTISAVSPAVAPAVGSVLDLYFGWRSIFVALAVLGVLAVGLALRFLPESLPAMDRNELRLGAATRSYARLLRNGRFLIPAVAVTVAYIVLFGYIGGATYVYQGSYGLSTSQFGLIFGTTGLAPLIGSGLATLSLRHLGTTRVALVGGLFVLAGTLTALLAILAHLPLAVLACGLGGFLFGLGYGEPALMGMSLTAIRRDIGAATAVIGAVSFLLGSMSATIIGSVATISPLAWTAALFSAAVLAQVLIAVSCRIHRSPEQGQGQEQVGDRPAPHTYETTNDLRESEG